MSGLAVCWANWRLAFGPDADGAVPMPSPGILGQGVVPANLGHLEEELGGEGTESDERLETIALLHEDEAAAERTETWFSALDDQVDFHGRPWSSLLVVGDIDTDERLVTVTAELGEHGSAGTPWHLIATDNLLYRAD